MIRKHHIPWILVGCAAMLWSTPGSSQDQPSMDPIAQFFDLHTRGRQAMMQEDPITAEVLFRAATRVQDLKIGWFRIGEALHAQGHCKKARKAFARATTAPHIPGMPELKRKELEFQLKEATDTMGPRCSGQLMILCTSPGLKAKVNGEDKACGHWFNLPPGDHKITGSIDSQKLPSQNIKVTSDHASSVSLRLPKANHAPTQALTHPQDEPTGLRTVAWTTGGLSIAALGFGAWMFIEAQDARTELNTLSSHLAPTTNAYKSSLDRYNKAHTLTWVGFGAGTGLALTSTFLLYLAYPSSTETPPATTAQALPPPQSLQLWLGPQSAGVHINF